MYSDSASDGGGESDGSDENEEMMPSGEDPKSDTTFVLPSMFAGRPPTVFFDYPAFMEKKRTEGVDRVEELTNDKLRPLHFRSNHTIICLGGALKRSGFKRLVRGRPPPVAFHVRRAALYMPCPARTQTRLDSSSRPLLACCFCRRAWAAVVPGRLVTR